MNSEFLSSFSSVSILSIICLYVTESLFKMPPAVGFLLAGILSSPSILNVSMAIKQGNLLGDFGMLFLMFYIGMEFSYSKLKSLKSYIEPSFVIYIVSTVLILLGVSRFISSGWFPNLYNNFFSVICIVSCLSMASTAVTMELLERFAKNQYIIYLVVTSLILQDVIVILLMLLTSNNIFQGSFFDIFFKRIILPLVVTVSYILLTENFLFKPVMRFLYTKNNNHILPIFSILLVVLSSYLSVINGISQEFGVFIIGMLIGDTEYKYSIISDIKPFQDIFLGLFFLSIGATFNLNFFLNYWLHLVIFFIVIFLIKFIGIFGSSYLYTKKFHKSLLLSIKLSNFSEIIFVILTNLRKNNYLNNYSLDFFTTITILSFFISPLINKIVQITFQKNFDNIPEDFKSQKYDVIIIGFSKQLIPIIKMLEENRINYVIIEKNLKKIELAKNIHCHITYGDMFNHQMLSNINIQWDTVVFINFSIMSHHISNLISFRKKFHNVKLIALANLESESLAQRFNIDIITNPYLEQSIHIGKTLLQYVNNNYNDLDLEIYINNFRNRWNHDNNYDNNNLLE